MHAATKVGEISQIVKFASTNLTEIRQNRKFRQTDFALTNFTKIRLNRSICHFVTACISGHERSWENTRKVCKSRARGKLITNFCRVLPASQVRY